MTTNKRNSTIFNILTTFATKLIVILGGFIVSVILARLLGPEGKGIVVAIFAIPLMIASLANLGVRQATAYYIGKKIYQLSDIVKSVSLLWLLSSTFSVVLVIIIYSTGSSQMYGWNILYFALLTIPLRLISEYSQGIIQGQEKIGKINISSLLGVASCLMGILLLVWIFDLGVYGAVIVNVVVALVLAIYSLLVIKNSVPISIGYISPIPKKLFTKGIMFALALFVLNLNYKIDIVLLERLTSPGEVGLYSVGTNLAELIWQLPAAMGIVLFARSANSKTEQEAVYRSTLLLRLVMPFLLFACLILATIAPSFISIVYGNEFIGSSNVIRLLLPGVFIMVIVKILHPDLAGRGYPLYAFWVYLGPVILNIIINLQLIPVYGIYGAAIASTISYSVGGIAFGIVYARKERVSVKDMILFNVNDIKLIQNQVKNIFKV